ncbi:MAG: phosphatase [Cytophagales bacterium]|nr:phosphatase [Cytophagales bacterium]
MKLAAIDIGSNAVRLQVSSITQFQEQTTLKKIEYLRFPLRLGHDVFTSQCVSPESERKLIKLLHAFKLLIIDLYQVDDYMVCATSAIREAKNKLAVKTHVKEKLGLEIKIIDGEEEAELIGKAIRHLLDEKSYLHIDVGGGSTELSLYVNQKKMASRSFKIGSVRMLTHHDLQLTWKEMKAWIKAQKKPIKENIIGIGTGGNIHKLFELAKRKIGKPFSLKKLKAIREYLASYTYEERVNILQLNVDRADVILPASQIYISAMEWGGIEQILVPHMGIKDGMLQVLYEKNLSPP